MSLGKMVLGIYIANGKKTIDELVVPANQPVKLIMSSYDVLHSFFLPNLRVKECNTKQIHYIIV